MMIRKDRIALIAGAVAVLFGILLLDVRSFFRSKTKFRGSKGLL